MIIKVKKVNVYGKDLVYPLDFVKELASLTNSKTLTYTHLASLKALGHSFELVVDKI